MEIIRQNKKPIIVNVFATFVYKKNLGYVIFSLPCRRWRKLLEVMKTILSAILLLCSTSLLWAQSAEHAFKLAFNHIGVSSIRNTADSLPTDYIRSGKAFGSFFIQYRKTGIPDWTSSQSEDMIREVSTSTAVRRYGPVDNTRNLLTEATFRLIGDELIYELSLSNNSDSPIEIGTLRFSIPYNRLSGESPKQIFEERVLKHHFISGDGSYLFFQRPTGKGPYLVMTPLAGTALEYYDLGDPKSRDNRDFTVYAHAQSTVKEDNVHWRLPLTKGLINPGDTLRYGFRFSWAGDYDAIRQVLVTAGLPDIRIVPGMTVPNNLTVKFAIRSSTPIHAIHAEFPSETAITKLPASGDKQLFEARFKRLGENKLTVLFGKNQTTYLEFFITEPIATLYKKRATFLANTQQIKAPGKWYDGLFGQWNMRDTMVLSPDNPDGFDQSRLVYLLTCDDPGLAKAPFLAAKNLYFPEQQEITAIDYYIDNFVWGKLQRTDKEYPYPYGVYGTPDWYTNRDPEKRKAITNQNLDKEHIWRSYDYPHIFMLYFHMYQLASKYPAFQFSHSADTYFIRAKETAKAYFTYPYDILPWYETYKWGCYNELLLVDIIAELEKKGYREDADWLRHEWEKKVKYFIYDDPYPYRSEYSIDATAFESSHALAKYALHNELRPDTNLWFDKNLEKWYSHPHVHRDSALQFMEEQIQANIACRGWLENAYYLKGSDFRGNSDKYLLSYMAQMGGWSIMDYALHYAKNPSEYLSLGYASYLSSFALMNTGDAASNYGFWHSGKENDGASGWAFEPLLRTTSWIQREQYRGPWYYDGEIDLGYGGALRSAATIVVNDPDFNWYAYGGDLLHRGDRFAVQPKDGLQQRFYFLNGETKLAITCETDGFAPASDAITFDISLSDITLVLENRTNMPHEQQLTLSGFPAGTYAVELNGRALTDLRTTSVATLLTIPVTHENQRYTVRLKKYGG